MTGKVTSSPAPSSSTTPISGPSFACSHCGLTFSLLVLYNAHLRKEHKNVTKLVPGAKCDQCGQKFLSVRALEIHVEAVHGDKAGNETTTAAGAEGVARDEALKPGGSSASELGRIGVEEALSMLLDGRVIEDDAIMRAIDEHLRLDMEDVFEPEHRHGPSDDHEDGGGEETLREDSGGGRGVEVTAKEDDDDGVPKSRLRDRRKIRGPKVPLFEDDFEFDVGGRKRRKKGHEGEKP
jgi:hypothetical protein